jgi:hypothetical protein
VLNPAQASKALKAVHPESDGIFRGRLPGRVPRPARAARGG